MRFCSCGIELQRIEPVSGDCPTASNEKSSAAPSSGPSLGRRRGEAVAEEESSAADRREACERHSWRV